MAEENYIPRMPYGSISRLSAESGVKYNTLVAILAKKNYKTSPATAKKIIDAVGGSALLWTEATPVSVRRNFVINFYRRPL